MKLNYIFLLFSTNYTFLDFQIGAQMMLVGLDWLVSAFSGLTMICG